MSKKWIILIKKFILSGGRDTRSFKQGIEILHEEKYETGVLNEITNSLKILYEIAEKGGKKLYWQMYNDGIITNSILRLDKLGFNKEALFIQIIYMVLNFYFQIKQGRFTIDFISFKVNMTIEEYKIELRNHEINIYTFIDCFLWFNDLELMNFARTLFVITLESIREIYIELALEKEAINLYKNLKSWLDGKKTDYKKWKEIFYIYIYTGKFEIYARVLNVDKAEKYFNIAKELLESVEPKDDQVYFIQINLLGNRGNAEKIKRNYEKSLEYFKDAYEFNELYSDKTNISYKLWKARLGHHIGSCYFEIKNHHIAEREYLPSIVMFRELLVENNPLINEDYIRVCLDRANNYHKLKGIKHTIELLEKLLDELKDLEKKKIRNYDSLKVQVLQQISKYYQELNMHDKVIEHLKESEVIIEKQEEKKTIMETRVYESYRHLAIQYREYDLDKSEYYLRKAIKQFEEITDENKKPAFYEHYIAVLHELGTILKIKKDYKKSMKYYVKAVDLQEGVVNKKTNTASSLAIYLNNLGNLHLAIRSNEYAKIILEYCYRIRLKLFEINKNTSFDKKPDRAHIIDLCNIMNDIGVLYLNLREFYRAVPILNDALNKINQIVDINQFTSYENEIKANILANLSRGQMNLGEFEFAYINIEEALDIRKKLYFTHPKKFLNKLMTDYYLFGLLNNISGNKDEAIKLCNEALEQLENEEIKDYEEGHRFRQEIINDLNEIPKIEQLVEFTNKIFTSKTGIVDQRIILAKNDKIANSSIIEKNIIKEIDDISSTKTLNWETLTRIFSFIELSKFEYYSYFNALKEKIENIPSNLDHIGLLNELNEKSILRKHLVDSISIPEKIKLKEFIEIVRQIYETELDCLEIITKFYYLIDKPMEDSKDINIIKDYLTDQTNESILLITKLTDNILLLLFTQDKVLCEKIDLEFLKFGWELQNKLSDYNDNINSPSKRNILQKEISNLGIKLWGKIPEDIQFELKNSEQVIISTSNDMEMIPFELLKSDNEYLGLTKVITRIFSSLSYVNRKKLEKKTENQLTSNFKALLITEPNRIGEIPLVKAQEENENITKTLKEKFGKTINIQKLEKGNVHKKPLLKLFLENEFQMIHFIAHGENNKIFISNNKEFDSLDLLENYLWLGNTSVFLNVCKVGSFTYYSDIILKGFIPNLLKIMTGSVITSQHKIEDTNAYTLAKEFYLNLTKGIDVGNSLKNARNLLFKNSKKHDKLEWANFLLFGNSNHKIIN